MQFNVPRIFRGVVDNWVSDYRTQPLVFWLELIGTLGCIVASASLAIMAKNPHLLFTYCAYLTGSSTLMISSYMRNNGFWVGLNAFFMFIDLVGLYNLYS